VRLEQQIAALEATIEGVSGLTITRCIMDSSLLDKFEITPPTEVKESYLVWSVAVGRMLMPKRFFYGWTIAEALDRASETCL
jgi:hypothetical protein